jgi:metal-dependent amidase/aminoacylase/carboxypeptidase family protein
MGASYQFKVNLGSPLVINDDELTRFIAGAAAEVLGEDGVQLMPRPLLGGEDFAWYQRKIPGCFIRLGTQSDAATGNYLHTSHFNIDEAALKVGVTVISWTLIKYLQQH